MAPSSSPHAQSRAALTKTMLYASTHRLQTRAPQLTFVMLLALALTSLVACGGARPPPPESPRTTTGQDSADLIVIRTPKPNALLESPLRLEGKARGYWFFEANLPVTLLDESGQVISQGYVTAKTEWMTTEFVPFEGTLTFEPPTTKTGTLVFQKANASDLPQHDDALHVPVRFAP
jgi:hypothetical protein